MLDIDNSDDEFQIKSGCLRKKSVDFHREKESHLNKNVSSFDLIRAEEAQKMAKVRKQTLYSKRRN